MIKVIGLTGVKGSGKTTTFNFIKELAPRAREVMLAGKLKRVCSEMFNIPMSFILDREKKEAVLPSPVVLDRSQLIRVASEYGYNFTTASQITPHVGVYLESPRRVLQYIGTEFLRQFDEEIHCNVAASQMKDGNGFYVVTDVRFPNEFDFFKAKFPKGFFPIYVANEVAEDKAKSDGHPSETQVLDIAKRCYRLDNNGRLEDLYTAVNKALYVLDISVEEGGW